MRSNHRLTIRMCTLFALALLPAFAASDDWSRVQALRPGTKVTVVQSDMKSWRGALRAASSSEMIVESAGTDVTIPRDRVVRVTRHKRSRRVTNALVLALAGGLIGAGATRFGLACAETNDGCRNAALASYGGVAAGAALGAALPDTFEVYRIRSAKH